MADISATRTTEITVNFRHLALRTKCNKRASGSIKRLKSFVQRQFSSKDPVYISQDLNKAIWARGQNHLIGRLRIRIERGQCEVNPETRCFRVSLVDVSSFKGLKDARIEE